MDTLSLKQLIHQQLKVKRAAERVNLSRRCKLVLVEADDGADFFTWERYLQEDYIRGRVFNLIDSFYDKTEADSSFAPENDNLIVSVTETLYPNLLAKEIAVNFPDQVSLRDPRDQYDFLVSKGYDETAFLKLIADVEA